QLADPILLNADSSFWESHAHNEILETLCSLGIPGAVALLLAIYWTFPTAVRAVDATQSPQRRIWIIALAGAFAAICGEELTDVALHKPGFPAIALTVWACLWAMSRTAGAPARRETVSAKPWLVAGLCCLMLAVTTVAAGLTIFDATAVRAQF